jgi:ribosomal protein L33
MIEELEYEWDIRTCSECKEEFYTSKTDYVFICTICQSNNYIKKDCQNDDIMEMFTEEL